MRKGFAAVYALCAVFFVVYLGFVTVAGGPDEAAKRSDEGYARVTDYTSDQQRTENTDVGIVNRYYIPLTETPKGDYVLAFYSTHANVSVCLDGETIYSFRQPKRRGLGRTPGCRWKLIPLYPEDAGSELLVELEPVYTTVMDEDPEFLLGSGLTIWRGIVVHDLPAMVLSIISILCGACFIGFVLYNIRNPEVDKSLFMMGQFAVLIGVWKLADLDCMSILISSYRYQAYIPYIALLLLVVPYTMYVRGLFTTRSGLIWDIPCIASLAVIIVTLVLQVTGIRDFRQMLWVNHLTMAILIVVVFLMLGLELRRVGWSHKLKMMVVCLLTCLLGMAVDITTYYITHGSSSMVMGMVGFLIYIVVLGVMSMREARRLMAIGTKAKRFEQLAYHDQLTGLYNRTAYADYIRHPDFSPKGCIVVMFDLNNLKFCNDTYGHEKGDLYIVSSAKLIDKVFGKMGRCCRMGGDEFCVVMTRYTEKECQRLQLILKKEVANWNHTHKEPFQMQIASGYAVYDDSVDYDIGDTLRRADKMMYKEKFVMKQKRMA